MRKSVETSVPFRKTGHLEGVAHKILVTVTAAFIVAYSSASAATLTVTPYPNNAYAVFINGESTVFNALSFTATPNGAAQFRNPGPRAFGNPLRPPGQTFTYRNRNLDMDPADEDNPGGEGWTLVEPPTTTPLSSPLAADPRSNDRHLV